MSIPDLKAAKLEDFFDVQVDGNMIHAQHLARTSVPDTFLMPAKLLGRADTRGCNRGCHLGGAARVRRELWPCDRRRVQGE